MPLLDHFHPPLFGKRHWESFHSAWAAYLAEDLNRRLPEHYFAEEFPHAGAAVVEIDVGTFEDAVGSADADGSATATLPSKTWAPPKAAFTIPAVFADDFEVRVISNKPGPTLVAAIELVSPRNKDRAEARRAFAIKCASYLIKESVSSSSILSPLAALICICKSCNFSNRRRRLTSPPRQRFTQWPISRYAGKDAKKSISGRSRSL
jgi:hypothetical protein